MSMTNKLPVNTPERTFKQFLLLGFAILLLIVLLLVVQGVYQNHIQQKNLQLELFIAEKIEKLAIYQSTGKESTNQLLTLEAFYVQDQWLNKQLAILQEIQQRQTLINSETQPIISELDHLLKKLNQKLRTWQYWADKAEPIIDDITANRTFNQATQHLSRAEKQIEQRIGLFMLYQAENLQSLNAKNLPTGANSRPNANPMQTRLYLYKLKSEFGRVKSYIENISREYSQTQIVNIRQNQLIPALLDLYNLLQRKQTHSNRAFELQLLAHLTRFSKATLGSNFELESLYASDALVNGGFIQLRSIYLNLENKRKSYQSQNNDLFSQLRIQTDSLYTNLTKVVTRSEQTVKENINQLWTLSAFFVVSAVLWLLFVARKHIRDIKAQWMAIETSENQLNKTIESTWDGFITINASGEIQSLNTAAQRIFGPENIRIGIRIQNLLPDFELSLASDNQQLIELTGYGNNRIKIPMELSISEISIPNKEQTKYVVTVRDVSKTERMLAAEQANIAKTEFLSSMSHELRTPLNSIIGFSQLLKNACQSDQQKRQATNILNSGHHLLDLINDILDFSKLDSGNISVSINKVALLPIINELLSTISPQAEEKGIRIKAEDFTCDHSLLCDATRLKQILLNLISNAIKYNQVNGEVRIHCQPSHNRTNLTISIEDTGIGISAEKLPKLFQAFDRLGLENSNIEGTGIGLNICKKLIEKMNGSIEVYSTQGVGSTFKVLLPLAKGQDAQMAKAAPQQIANQTKTSVENSQQHFQVLYIEDDFSCRELIEDILVNIENVNLEVCASAEEGLEKAKTFKPNMILCDINLPGMNGDEALPFFKSLPELKDLNTRYIALTANAEKQQIKKGLEAGFEEYIKKPVTIEAIRGLFKEVLKE